LKTLEEPPAHVKFIFATTDPHKVPRTIHSRCQRYDFKRIPLRLIADQLQAIVSKDGIEAEADALLLIAREAEGSMRDAQSLLDQVLAFAGKRLSTADAVQALGLADRAQVRRLGEAIVARQPAEAVAVLDELYSYGYDLRRLARDLLEHFRNLATAKVAPGSDLLAELPDEERAAIERDAQSTSSEELDRSFRVLLDTEAELARVPYPKLVFDMAVLKLATLPPLLSAEDLLAAVESARDQISRGNPAPAAAPTPIRREPPPAPTATARAASSPLPAATAAAAAPSGPTSWDGFLEFVGKNKITLLAYLQASPPPDICGNKLSLSVPKGYYLDYLGQRDHIALVEELASRYFGRPISVAVSASAPAPASAKPVEQGPSAAELHAQAADDPKVQAALEILGGEIREVRPRRRRIEENT
ncbi:MAG TPA: hypothetical protein VEB21_04430, partial [Terriglobales bacterium]|nr:hypothetical protein [Terriglobales bacterium]